MQSKILHIIDQATKQTKLVRVKTKLLRGDVKSIVYRGRGRGREEGMACAPLTCSLVIFLSRYNISLARRYMDIVNSFLRARNTL